MMDELLNNLAVSAAPVSEPKKTTRKTKAKEVAAEAATPEPVVVERVEYGLSAIPTKMDGSAISNLTQKVYGKFEQVVVAKVEDGKVAREFSVSDLAGADQIWLASLLASYTMSTSAERDGSTKFAYEQAQRVLAAQPGWLDYEIQLVPSGRAGLEKYFVGVKALLELARMNYILLKTSIERGASAKAPETRGPKETATSGVKL